MRLKTEQRAEITRNIKLIGNSLFVVTFNGDDSVNNNSELVYESKLNGKIFEFGVGECDYTTYDIKDLDGFEVDLPYDLEKIDLDWFKRVFLKELRDLKEEYKDLIQRYEQEQINSNYLDNDFERFKENNY